MFRKIVTELTYSPALAGSLGDYVRLLRNERSKRQIGVIFVLLAVVVQLFATLFPPESANANNPDVFIDGGIQSIEDYLGYYDQNTKSVRDLLASLGISRSDIEAAHLTNLPTSAGTSLWSLQNSRSDNTSSYYFQTASGKRGVAYSQPFNPLGNSPLAYLGSPRSAGGWFAIIKDTSNLITEKPISSSCAVSPTTDPLVVGSRSKGELCSDTLELALSARAISPTSPTSLHKAHASDRIAYTISVTNKSDHDIPLVPTISLEDALEYSRILDNGGGEYNFDTKTIGWPAITLSAGETTERSYIVQLLPTIPSTARGQYIAASYDCTISTSFGTTLSIPIACPLTKHIERVTNSLPYLSTKVNLIFASCLLLAALYFYLRSRLLLTELYIIRHIHLGSL